MAILYSHVFSVERWAKSVPSAPGAQEGLLNGVLGLGTRAEHPVAVAGQLTAVDVELNGEIVGPDGCGDSHATPC